MANFQGIPLLGAMKISGALYPLRAAPEFSGTVELSTGQEVEVREGIKAVVVRGISATSYESAVDTAPEFANQGLDIFTLKGRPPLALQDVEDSHVAWWVEGREAVIRFWCSSTTTPSFRAVGEVRGADGQLKRPDAEITPPWQESMRYYRMSELTDDLFDAFRNVYLALESLLSWHRPRVQINGVREKEEVWFKNALKDAGRSLDLRSFSIPSSGNPVHDIYNELHNQMRNRTFHAKDVRSHTNPNGAKSLLPLRITDRSQVASAKERFTLLYLALAENAFDTKIPVGGSGLSREAIRRVLDAITHGWDIAFTSDFSPAASSDLHVSPKGEQFATIPGRSCTDSRGDDYISVVADVRTSDITNGVSSVGRMATIYQDGELGAIHSLDGRLHLEGFDRCEFAFSFHIAGQRARKTRYAT